MSMARGVDPPAHRRVLARAGARRQRLQLLLSARQYACEKGRGQGRLDRNAPVGRAQAGRRDAGRGRPRHCARRGERGPDQGWQTHQPALGEPEDRRPWHGHAARLDLPTGRHHLPRFSRQLRQEWQRVLGCRARPAAPSAANGKCAICAPGAAPSAKSLSARCSQTLTEVMIPLGKISSGSARRCAMPCSWV